MISWRLCLVFAVISYSESTTIPCSHNNECTKRDYERCCKNIICRLRYTDKKLTSPVAITVVTCAVIGIIISCVCCCYCWQRSQCCTIVFRRFATDENTVIVRHARTEMTPIASQGYTTLPEGNNPVQQGYSYQVYDCPPGTTFNQGDIITNPTNNPHPPYTKEHAF